MKFTFGTLSGRDILTTIEGLGINLQHGENKVVCDYGSGYPHIAQEIAGLQSVSQVNCIDKDYPETVEKKALFKGRVNDLQKLEDFDSVTPYDHVLFRLRKKVIMRFREILKADGGLSTKISLHRDVTGLPNKSQDLVMANFLFSNLDFVHEVLFDCRRILKDDGHLIITDHGHEFSDGGLGFLMQKIQEFGIPCSEREIIMPLGGLSPQSAKTIHIKAKDLQELVKKMLIGTPEGGLRKITVDLNKIYGDESSQPWEVEYILIPYERIAKQQLSLEEVTVLKKLQGFSLESYANEKIKYWEEPIDGETSGDKLLRTHMVVYETQNGRGGYEMKEEYDIDSAELIAHTIEG